MISIRVHKGPPVVLQLLDLEKPCRVLFHFVQAASVVTVVWILGFLIWDSKFLTEAI